MKPIKIPDTYKYMSAFLTFKCPLECSYCLNTLDEKFTRKSKELSGYQWIKGLNRIVSRPELPITLTGGEPFAHPDFIEIVKNIKPELNIDLLTTLGKNKKKLEEFIREISPERIKRDSNYPSIRLSYHPEKMFEGEELVDKTKRLKDLGFSIGIYGIKYPSPEQLQANTKMQFRCLNKGVNYREKDFIGQYKGKDDLERPFQITHGNFSIFPDCSFQQETKSCSCKTSELLIGPNGDVYRCHRDLYAQENPTGNILDSEFEIKDIFRTCKEYGHCHPCDTKVTTNYKQEVIGHTSVEIKNILPKS